MPILPALQLGFPDRQQKANSLLRTWPTDNQKSWKEVEMSSPPLPPQLLIISCCWLGAELRGTSMFQALQTSFRIIDQFPGFRQLCICSVSCHYNCPLFQFYKIHYNCTNHNQRLYSALFSFLSPLFPHNSLCPSPLPPHQLSAKWFLYFLTCSSNSVPMRSSSIRMTSRAFFSIISA